MFITLNTNRLLFDKKKNVCIVRYTTIIDVLYDITLYFNNYLFYYHNQNTNMN